MTITTKLRTEAAQTHTRLIAATTTAYNAIAAIGTTTLNTQESMLLLTINSKEELNLTERSQKETRHDAILNAYSSIHGHMHYFPRAENPPHRKQEIPTPRQQGTPHLRSRLHAYRVLPKTQRHAR